MTGSQSQAAITAEDGSLSHPVFSDFDLATEFYEALSSLVWGHITRTRHFLGNLDSSFFDSLAGTASSMRDVLVKGRVADGYTLLRRFMETARMQVHVMLQLEAADSRQAGPSANEGDFDAEAFSRWLEDAFARGFYVDEVEDWLIGKKSIKAQAPSTSDSPSINSLGSLFDRTKHKAILDRCNHNVHLNFYWNLRLNGPNLDHRAELDWLDQVRNDFCDLCIWHVCHVFSIRAEYMGSSDYIDALECGVAPIEGSQYWVAPIVQRLFDDLVTPRRPDVTAFLRQTCYMELA